VAVGTLAVVLVLLLEVGTDGAGDEQATDLPGPAELADPESEGRAAAGPMADAPRCTTDDGCVAWQLRLGGWRDAFVGPSQGLTMTAEVLLLPRVGGLRAVDLRTGETRWARDLLDLVVADDPPTGVAAADGLALLGGMDGSLTALEIGDGTLRWSATVPELHRVTEAKIVDGRLIVAGASVPSGEGGARVVAALDPTDGTVHWSQRAHQAELTTLGPVLADPFERLWRIDVVTVEPVWERELAIAAPGLTAVGPVLIVDDGHGRRLLDAASGTALVELAAAPDPGLPVPEPPVVVAGLGSATLIEDDGVAWTIEVPGGDCCAGSQVTGDEVDLHLLGQTSLTLDRATGAVRSARAAPDLGGAFAWRFGDLLVVSDGVGGDGTGELVIRDAASGRNVARSSAAWPALTPDGGLLLVAPEWIARLRSTG
jgi:hypothetical protein